MNPAIRNLRTPLVGSNMLVAFGGMNWYWILLLELAWELEWESVPVVELANGVVLVHGGVVAEAGAEELNPNGLGTEPNVQ